NRISIATGSECAGDADGAGICQRARASVAASQIVVIKRGDRLSASAVEVNGAACDRVSYGRTGRKDTSDTDSSGTCQYLILIAESKVAVIECQHVLAGGPLIVIDRAGRSARNAAGGH